MFSWWQRKKKNKGSNGRFRYGNDHLIELRRVSKIYETAAGPFKALREIDLQIDHGEFVAVIGKSGSGKSTLINMIAGIDRPSAGEVLIGDTAVHTLNEGQIAVWRGRNVGVIFQFFQLLPTLTAIENVMLPMDFCDMYSMSERYERAMHLLDQVEMVEHAHKLPSALSGGEQQRVAIARAMANDPPILLADEPTGNLDSQTAEAVMQLFEKLVAQDKTILMVTHDMDLSRRAPRIITLADGQIVAQTSAGPTTAVGGRPSTDTLPQALSNPTSSQSNDGFEETSPESSPTHLSSSARMPSGGRRSQNRRPPVGGEASHSAVGGLSAEEDSHA